MAEEGIGSLTIAGKNCDAGVKAHWSCFVGVSFIRRFDNSCYSFQNVPHPLGRVGTAEIFDNHSESPSAQAPHVVRGGKLDPQSPDGLVEDRIRPVVADRLAVGAAAGKGNEHKGPGGA